MERRKEVAFWTVSGTSGANATLSVAKAAETDAVHVITDVDIAFSDMDDPVGTRVWNFKNGATNSDASYVAGDVHLRNRDGLFKASVGAEVSLAVAAGGATIVSKGIIRGYTVVIPS